MARTDPEVLVRRARESMAMHCAAMVGFLDAGAEVFDYGNSLRAEAELGGFDRAFAYPGFLPAYIRPLFCEGKGPFRWVALSGDPADIAATDRAVLEEFPDDDGLARWIRLAGERVAFQGLPARICWLGYGERAPPRCPVQRAGAPRRRRCADRDRPRPPRLGLGRLAVPRDRGDGRRLRRHRRLAVAQRTRQHGVGCDVGVAAPRRWRRHRTLDPRRDGRRRRRHRPRCGQAGARADDRSGHGRDPPRRRRLRHRPRRRPRPRRAPADDGDRDDDRGRLLSTTGRSACAARSPTSTSSWHGRRSTPTSPTSRRSPSGRAATTTARSSRTSATGSGCRRSSASPGSPAPPPSPPR